MQELLDLIVMPSITRTINPEYQKSGRHCPGKMRSVEGSDTWKGSGLGSGREVEYVEGSDQ